MIDITDRAAVEGPHEGANWVALLLPVVLDVAVPTALFDVLRGRAAVPYPPVCCPASSLPSARSFQW